MAAPAYHNYATAPAADPRRSRGAQRANVRVVPGSRTSEAPQTSSTFIIAAIVVAIILVVFTLLSFARIAISSAAIATSIQSQEISSQIETARSQGNKLEVDESKLSNSALIKKKAEKLGMSAAYGADVMTMEPDVVALDGQGNISLTESVRRASDAVKG